LPNVPGCSLSAGSPSLSPMARVYRASAGRPLHARESHGHV
jgi:hypothetical protein